MTYSLRSDSSLPLLQPALAWLPILGLIALCALCVAGNLGSLLNLLFPAGAFAVSIFLYWRYPLVYVSFTWWLWFLSAWVRRLADFRGAGWTDPSPILLAPFLATLVSAVTFWRCLRYPNTGLPFLLCAASVVYAFLVGAVLNSPQSAVLSLIGWLGPIFFGFHLFTNWRDYPYYRQVLQRTFLWGVLVMGGYGIVQYLVAPDWDRVWMTNALIHNGLNIIGDPEPLGIRVFSTLNSPQPFAGMMTAGLLLLLSLPSKLQPLAAGLGLVAHLLSLARSAWVSLIVGLFVLVPSLKSSLQIRLFSSLLILILIIVPITQVEPFSSTILPRIQGLTSPSEDVSANARIEGYERLLGEAMSSIPGKGLGFVFVDDSIGSEDSGILTLWFTLGWLGVLPYLLGMGLLFFSLFQTSASQFDLFSSAARAIAVSTFAQVGFNIITEGHLAMVLWSFLGIGMAARQYHTSQQQTP
ncbi:MAG: O-antigen ligase domain-containing protein [Phormidesmis sp.]